MLGHGRRWIALHGRVCASTLALRLRAKSAGRSYFPGVRLGISATLAMYPRAQSRAAPIPGNDTWMRRQVERMNEVA